MRRLGAVLALLVGFLGVPEARGESLVAATSTNVVNINSNFTGTNITVFGSIERDRATVSRAAEYRIAVQIFGPRETVVTRRKERVFGIWVNRSERTYVDVPSFYAVLSTGPIDQLATRETMRRYQIGLDQLILPEHSPGLEEMAAGNADFRAGFLRLKLRSGLYQEHPGTVSFLSPNLFKASIPIPANVPVGRYTVQIVLFQEGVPLAEHSSDIVVSKTGFEQFMFDLAFTKPIIYGIITVLMALMTGWLAGIIFRRD